MGLREIKPVRAGHPLEEALKMEGKTVESVVVGDGPRRKQVHQTEIIRIKFTDGEILELTVGTNLREFEDRIDITQVIGDFDMVWWDQSGQLL